MSGSVHSWADLTSSEVAAFDSESTIVVLPLGATEQHGPHLPLGTDTIIAEAVLAATIDRLPTGVTILILPTQPVGLSVEHEDFAGTLSGEAETLLAFWGETAASVARAGLRKIVLFNSHGGQSALLSLAAQNLRRKLRMQAASYNCYRIWRDSDIFTVEERRYGIHGGAIETSIMMATRPDLVRRDRLADFPSAAERIERTMPALAPQGKLAVAWQMIDINPTGAAGDARIANAELGHTLLAEAATDFATFLEDFRRLGADFLTDHE